MFSLETQLYLGSAVLQVAAVVFAALMARQRIFRSPWLVMCAAFSLMLVFRVVALLTTGYQPLLPLSETAFHAFSASASVMISALLLVALFAIRRLSLAEERSAAARRQAEEDALEAERRYRAIFEATRDGLIINSPAGSIVEANPAACQMHGYDYDQFIGIHTKRIIHPDDRPLFDRFARTAGAGGTFRCEARDVRLDGTVFPVEVIGTGFTFKGATHLLGVVRDITERKQTEQSLADSEGRLKTLFDTTQDAILLADDQARYVDANPAACAMTGYAREELLGKSVWDLTPLPDRALGASLWRGFIEAGRQAGEYALTRKDGSTVDVDYRAVANMQPGLHLSVLRDVTERKRAEDAERLALHKLQESEERLRILAAVVERTSEFIGLCTPDRRTLFVNDAGRRMVGLDGADVDVLSVDPLDYFWPEDRPRIEQEAIPALQRDGRWSGEVRFRHFKTGEAIPTMWNPFVIRDDRSGAAIAWATVSPDLRRQKESEAELRHAKEQAERASQMKDEFLATLSHELRTPLNAILGWAQILRSGPPSADDLLTGLDTIDRNARAQTQIIEDLLDMSRIISGKVRLEVRQVELRGVVEAAIETVRHAADARGVRIESAFDQPSTGVSGDVNRLQQVFWNLLSNAVKFAGRGGQVRVRVECADGCARVAVADSGEGIKPDFLPFVFDRFRQADASTTRRHGGLGLGLAIVKQLVELHGGAVSAASAGEGHGATFTVTLPIVAATSSPAVSAEGAGDDVERPAAPLAPQAVELRLSGLTVLVVDDEPDARALIKRVLEEREATVVTSASVAEAWEMLQQHRPDVLVSDIAMPGEDGYALIRRVRARAPEDGGALPAIALTAYARAEDRMRAILAGYQMHVAKPVEPAELVTMVASLAGRTTTGG